MLRGRGNNGKNRQRGGAVDAKSCRFGSGLVRFSIRFRAPGTGTGSFYWCKGFLAKDILKSKGMAYRAVRRGGGARGSGARGSGARGSGARSCRK